MTFTRRERKRERSRRSYLRGPSTQTFLFPPANLPEETGSSTPSEPDLITQLLFCVCIPWGLEEPFIISAAPSRHMSTSDSEPTHDEDCLLAQSPMPWQCLNWNGTSQYLCVNPSLAPKWSYFATWRLASTFNGNRVRSLHFTTTSWRAVYKKPCQHVFILLCRYCGNVFSLHYDSCNHQVRVFHCF